MTRISNFKLRHKCIDIDQLNKVILLSIPVIIGALIGCAPDPISTIDDQIRINQTQSSPKGFNDGKADGYNDGIFPATRDLALMIPMQDANVLAIDHLPTSWMTAVSEGLLLSELGERIEDESWLDSWRLVSARFTVCSPLGRIANTEEIDRLCWPQARFVWQPVIESIAIHGLIRPYYSDDRAIHTLYAVDHTAIERSKMVKFIAEGGRLDELSSEELFTFEQARDRAGRTILEALYHLRQSEGPYHGFLERPEFYDTNETAEFQRKLGSFMERFATPEALHELTAFSLPLGRNPASSDLWSFIGFSGRDGVITPATLNVLDAQTGDLLFSFESSEDVTTGLGDEELTDALKKMPPVQRDRLSAQVITDTQQLNSHLDRINDPYQTLVAHTTCSSCHRANNLNFNFHNLSYLEDQEMSISPRVINDVSRDRALARALWFK
jgi:hypothetical protein